MKVYNILIASEQQPNKSLKLILFFSILIRNLFGWCTFGTCTIYRRVNVFRLLLSNTYKSALGCTTEPSPALCNRICLPLPFSMRSIKENTELINNKRKWGIAFYGKKIAKAKKKDETVRSKNTIIYPRHYMYA